MKKSLVLLTAGFLFLSCWGKSAAPVIIFSGKGKNPQKDFRVFREGGATVKLTPTGSALHVKANVPLKPVSGKRAQVRLSLKKEIIAKAMEDISRSGRRLTGIDFLIGGPEDAEKKFSVVLYIGPKLDRQFVLQPRDERFVFTPKLAAKPFSWDDLTHVLIYFSPGTAPEMMIKEIRLLTAPALPGRKLALSRHRKAHEILPSGKTFDTFFRRPELKQVSSGPRITLSYDEKELHVRSVARFDKAPAASVKVKDDRVYQDEAFEIFFAQKLDGQAYDQFCINAIGTVRDERFGFDPDAVMVRNMLEHDFPHRKKLNYDGKNMTFELHFPLSAFELEPGKQPFVEFQLAQAVNKRSHVLGISAKDRNFDLPSFSCAVLNRKPFGKGDIKITGAEIRGSGGSASIDAQIEISGVAQGEYKVDFIVSTPDFRRIDCAGGTVQIQKGNLKKTFKLNRLPDLNGMYVIRVLLTNRNKSVLASSVDVENVKKVAYRFAAGDFQPRLKHFKARPGKFSAGNIRKIVIPAKATDRTFKTAQLFCKYLLDFTGVTAEICRGGKGDVYLDVDPVRGGQKPQGYTLDVSEKVVRMTGCNEPGLYYAVQTFMQMVKMPMKRTVESPVPCCEIKDYPDLLARPANLWHPRSVPGSAPVIEPTSVEFICDFVERFAAANKLNYFRLRIDKSLMFESHPRFKEHAARRYYTMADLRKIAEFCRERFIDIIPVLPGGGHDALIDVFPEFKDPDWNATADVAKPGYMELYLACVKELIDATQCKYFVCGGDEWYFKRNKKRIAIPLPDKIHGKTRAEVFLDFHLQLHSFLKKHNVRMAMAHDMLIPDKNGRSFDIYKTLDKLPNDIIVVVWSPSKNEKLFRERGMEMWYGSTGSDIPGATRKFYSGYASSLYLFGTELSFRFPGAYKYHSKWFMTADTGWNYNSGLDCSIATGLADGRLAAVESLFAETASPAAGVNTVPLALPGGEKIDRALNRLYPHAYAQKQGNFALKSGVQNVGNITMTLSDRAIPVKPRDKNPAVVKVNRNVSGLIFLHSAFETASYRKTKKAVGGSVKNAWQKGYPVANYQVIYSDGSKESVPVRLGAQLYWFGYQPMAGSCTHTRFMYIGYDFMKRPVFLYQYEWVNPHPEKKVEKIILSHDNPLDFQALVFAVSAREVRK